MLSSASPVSRWPVPSKVFAKIPSVAIACCLYAASFGGEALAMAADAALPVPLTAEQIVEKNVAARGGLDAWRKVTTMAWVGHIEASNLPGGSLPFVFEFGRPNRTRFSVDPQGQPSARIFDGRNGWKVRRSRDGSPDVQPYSAEDLKAAVDGQGFDGPLIDYRAKGIAVNLDGRDDVDGRPAYRLIVRLPSGASQHVWVDAETFLDLRSDRDSRDRAGRAGKVWLTYRDYRTVDGLQLPTLIETSGADGKAPDRMVIDRVFLNPALSEQAFAKPEVAARRHKVVVDTRAAPPSGAGAPRAMAAEGAQGAR
jgi:hypothetical protein